ncbi:hypothetical protein [Agrococcus citreus]
MLTNAHLDHSGDLPALVRRCRSARRA